jgi:predicted lipoprotein with Yx(FWY)xxD motif
MGRPGSSDSRDRGTVLFDHLANSGLVTCTKACDGIGLHLAIFARVSEISTDTANRTVTSYRSANHHTEPGPDRTSRPYKQEQSNDHHHLEHPREASPSSPRCWRCAHPRRLWRFRLRRRAADAAATASVVSTGSTSEGDVLTDSAGLSLYGFTPDVGGTPTCVDGGAQSWPPLTVDGDALPDGLDPAVFSLVTHADGSTQLATGGWPLYLFAGDAVAGDRLHVDYGDPP